MGRLFTIYSRLTTAITAGKLNSLNKPMQKFICDPFFLYKIGKHEGDYFLYFKREPSSRSEYYNKIFDAIAHLPAFDSIEFIKFHQNHYPDKERFLSFLIFELNSRVDQLNLCLLPSTREAEEYRVKKLSILNNALSWVKTSIKADTFAQQTAVVNQLTNSINFQVTNYLYKEGDEKKDFDFDHLNKIISDEVSQVFDQFKIGTKEILDDLTTSYATGNIVTPLQTALDVFVAIMIVLREISFTADGKEQKYFGNFGDVDIAKMLHLHFNTYKTNQNEQDVLRKYVSSIKAKLYTSKCNQPRMDFDKSIKSLIEAI